MELKGSTYPVFITLIRSIYFAHSVSFRSSTHRDIRAEILRSFKHAFTCIQVVGHPAQTVLLACKRLLISFVARGKGTSFPLASKEIGNVRTQAKTVSHLLNAH